MVFTRHIFRTRTDIARTDSIVVKFSSHRAINFSHQRLQLMANKCANKANSVLGFIRRTVGPKNPELFSKLYKSLVCPILEYCSPVWCPHIKKDLNTLEKVQRRALKCALGNIGRLSRTSYEERLK